ncbi:MAG: hypothetical protein P1U30_01075 [Phycisphaerales bacterium]|nr:hypothetical protein [Phycisphaerales bacterium]
MRKTMIQGTLVLSALAFASTSALANVYSYDDGGSHVTLGPPRSFEQYGDIDMLWGNYFQTQDATEEITSISFELGRLSENNQVTVRIYQDSDNDFDPTNATNIYSTVIDNPMTGGGELNIVDIANLEVSGGFFVTVSHLAELVYDDEGQPGYSSPARYDTDGRADRSWFYYGSYGDLPNAGYHTRMDGPDVPFGGAFAIRANTVPVPSTMLISSAGLLMASRRRR